MFALRILLAAGSLTLINGAPVSSFVSDLSKRAPLSHSLQSRAASTYVKVFAGDGGADEGWPITSQWISSFDEMFDDNLDELSNSCAQYPGSPPNNSDSENDDLKSAINTVAASSDIDARFIFSIVMQESNGCVRAPTTDNGVTNPGLMQSHNGEGSCNDGTTIQNPCPLSEIISMIRDGTEGTSDGDGLKQLIAQAGTTDDSKYYIAARMYNSGSVASSGNLNDGIATHCYATDIANRLAGWSTGPTDCDANSAGAVSVVKEAFVSTNSEDTDESSASAAPASSAAASTASAGVFAQSPAASTPAAPEPTPAAPEPTTAAAAEPTTTITTTIAAPTTTTIAVAAAPSTVQAADPAQSSAPATVSPTEADPAVETSGSGVTLAAGSACTTNGEWNCIDASSFQQCGSGTWSAVQQLAEGTVCKSGHSAAIQITSAHSRRRHLNHLSPLHIVKHARRASF